MGRAEKDAPSAVTDLQKINRELEKLQLSDDESVFSSESGGMSPDQNGYATSTPKTMLLDYQASMAASMAASMTTGGDQEVRQSQSRHRRSSSSGQKLDVRAESPVVSLRGSAPSPSPRMSRTNNKVTPQCFFCFDLIVAGPEMSRNWCLVFNVVALLVLSPNG